MSQMQRVGASNPCPICKKNDWCLYGIDVAICMRVASNRPKPFSDGTTGYLHDRNGGELPRPVIREKPVPHLNCGVILNKWAVNYGYKSLLYLAKTLGVTFESLEKLGCVKAPPHSTWAFPMYDGKRYIIGIRLRHENGKKWCEPGSHNGLFIPLGAVAKEIVICEGPTDTAAALSIDLYAIGRFNCSGGIHQIQEFIKDHNVKRATIVADCDSDRIINGNVANPGINGAVTLSEHIGIPTRIIALPQKDMRSFVQKGGNRETFNALTDQLVWSKP